MFPYEIYALISSFCDYKTVKNLCLCMGFDNSLIEFCNLGSGFRCKIIDRLTWYGLSDPGSLLGAIKSDRGYISGSFVLNRILDEDWDINDMDIFTFNTDGMHKELIEQGFSISSQTGTLEGSYPRLRRYLKGGIADFIGNFINYTNEKSSLKIQVIKLFKGEGSRPISSIIEYVRDTFDFDFCKTVYDGDELTIMEPESIRYKVCNICKLSDPISKLSRIAKYMSRGFIIHGIDTYYETFISNYATMNYRPKDYDYPKHSISYLHMEFYMEHIFRILGYSNMNNILHPYSGLDYTGTYYEIFGNGRGREWEYDTYLKDTNRHAILVNIDSGQYTLNSKGIMHSIDHTNTSVADTDTSTIDINLITFIMDNRLSIKNFDAQFISFQQHILTYIINPNKDKFDDILKGWMKDMILGIYT